MIISKPNHELEVGAGIQEHAFKWKANGKAFRILSDGLYSNKIRAIIREISCNAYDAHIAIGAPDVPFEVHLPNALESWFSVKDNGCGMSRDMVENTFTTFFESTKDESNDFVGALGLGSKSPFSYTDSFTVVTRYNGKKFSYNAYINQYDCPAIALLQEEDTDEVNGTEIMMTVDTKDFWTFNSEAEEVFKYFRVHPNVIGGMNYQPKTVAYTVETALWAVQKSERSYYSSVPSVIVQGNIGYPVQRDSITDLNGTERALIESGVEMRFPIGQIDFSASRESVSFTESTIKHVRERLALIESEYLEIYVKELNEEPTFWKATVRLRSLREEDRLIYRMGDGLKVTYQDTGRRIYSDVRIEADQHPNIVVSYFRAGRGTITNSLKEMRPHHGGASPLVTFGDPKSQFVIDDLKRGSHSRCRFNAKSNPGSLVVLLRVAEGGTQADIDAFVKDLGFPETVFASTLDSPPKSASTRAIRTSVNVVNHRVKDGVIDSLWFAQPEDDFEFENGGIFIPAFKCVHGTFDDADQFVDRFTKISLFDALSYLVDHGVIDLNTTTVVSVSSRSRKKFEKDDNWINLCDLIDEHLPKLVEDQLDDLVYHLAYSSESYRYSWELAFLRNVKQPETHILEIMNDAVHGVTDRDMVRLTGLASSNLKVWQTVCDARAKIEDFDSLYNKAKILYPMIQVGRSLVDVNATHLNEYIEMMDRKHSEEGNSK